MAKKLSDSIGQFATIPNSFIKQSGALSTEAKWLFVVLRHHTNSKTGNAFPSYTTIQEMTGFHRKTISKSLRELESAGWLTKQRRFGATTLYALQIPSSSISDTTGASEAGDSSSTKRTISSITSATISSSDGVNANQIEGNQTEVRNTAHSRLFKIHHDRLGGKIMDAPAQGKAVKTLLANYTEDECRECYESQLAEAWRRRKVSWLTVMKDIGSWLDNKTNPTPPKLSRTYEWQGRYFALGEVVSDDGERYTVMGADGTPSKRWHTPEAFALDTGRDVEKVRAGWN